MPSRGDGPQRGTSPPRGTAPTRRGGPPRDAVPRRGGFRMLRILILLVILLLVSVRTCQDQFFSTRWRNPLFVAIYPIAADDSPVTRAYLAALDAERFKPIDRFFVREAERYHLSTSEPFRTRLRPELQDRPPQRAAEAGVLSTALWSLRLRYWAWHVSGHAHDPEDIRMFVLYDDPALTPSVPHSLGLMKGLIGVVYAFAAPEMNEANNVVIAHELLHTVGATDKYNFVDDAPRFPDGYGDAAQKPLYPQLTAELMAGRSMLADAGAGSFESAAPLLECRGIDVCVGSRTLVRGLDLQLGRGSVLAVLGPNGSGKSLSLPASSKRCCSAVIRTSLDGNGNRPGTSPSRRTPWPRWGLPATRSAM